MVYFKDLLNKWATIKEIREAEEDKEYNPCDEYIGLINKFLMDIRMTEKEKSALNAHLSDCKNCRLYTYKTKIDMPQIPKTIPKELEEKIKKINEEIFKKYKNKGGKKK